MCSMGAQGTELGKDHAMFPALLAKLAIAAQVVMIGQKWLCYLARSFRILGLVLEYALTGPTRLTFGGYSCDSVSNIPGPRSGDMKSFVM